MLGSQSLATGAALRIPTGGPDAVSHPLSARGVTRGDQGGSSGAPGPLVPTVVRLAMFPPWLVPLRQGAIPRRGVSSIARPYFGGARLMVWLARG